MNQVRRNSQNFGSSLDCRVSIIELKTFKAGFNKQTEVSMLGRQVKWQLADHGEELHFGWPVLLEMSSDWFHVSNISSQFRTTNISGDNHTHLSNDWSVNVNSNENCSAVALPATDLISSSSKVNMKSKLLRKAFLQITKIEDEN